MAFRAGILPILLAVTVVLASAAENHLTENGKETGNHSMGHGNDSHGEGMCLESKEKHFHFPAGIQSQVLAQLSAVSPWSMVVRSQRV